jgi:CubicO group peptidase (beta-lactamase class C family)
MAMAIPMETGARARRRRIALGLLVAVCQITALRAGAFEPLPRTPPETLGIDAAGIDRFLHDLDQVPGAQSVVVVHRDQVVAEAYWTGSASTLRNLRSVTKSVTSTLIGIAIDRGFIGDVDSRMVDYLPPALVPTNPAKDAILLRHLLTHTSGLQWNENLEFETWATSSNPLLFILNRPLVSQPGTSFNYSTPGAHVLSAVLEEATALDEAAFADATLFTPLGISRWRWEQDARGYPFGGHGLELRTEDMAKLGVLYLDRGRRGDQQVVPTSWIDTATDLHRQETSTWGPLVRVSYGYLWWLAAAGETDLFMAIGWGGQFVICVPTLDLVVATNADWQVDSGTANAQEHAILELIVEKLLPLIPVRHHRPLRPSRRIRPPQSTAARAVVDSSAASSTPRSAPN